VVVLFTRDLRVHDHPALSAACTSARMVVPLFVVDPSITDLPTASANRLSFLFESLTDLRASLIRRGADLYVRRGDVLSEAMKVVAQTGATALVASGYVSRIARGRQQRFERACRLQRCRFELFPGVTVVPPGEVVPAGKVHYAGFTPYWNGWREAPRRVPVRRILAEYAGGHDDMAGEGTSRLSAQLHFGCPARAGTACRRSRAVRAIAVLA
jgi:deoxyribodipyrimidine photo-lyase